VKLNAFGSRSTYEPHLRCLTNGDGQTLDERWQQTECPVIGGWKVLDKRTYAETPFAEQEADLRRLMDVLPVARLSIDRSGIGMNLAENLARDFPQVVPENFTNEAKERWATDFKILLQRREVVLPRNRDLVAQVHSIKKRVMPSGKVAFDAERTSKGGHADRFWAIALACQKQRAMGRASAAEIGVRVIG